MDSSTNETQATAISENIQKDDPRLDIVVEYDEESDYTTVFLTPVEMEGVNPSVVKIRNEDFIDFDGDELTEQLKDIIVKDGFDEIDAITAEMGETNFITEGVDHATRLHELATLIAEEVSRQITKDKKRQMEMLDELGVEFEVADIHTGTSLQRRQELDDVDFTVNVNGEIELDPSIPAEKDPFQDAAPESKESLTEANASVGLIVAGRHIPLGDLSYFYGLRKNGKAGITAKDLKGTDVLDELKIQVDEMIRSGTLAPPRILTEKMMVMKLVKAINHATAKHFGVEHDKLAKDPEQQKIFKLQSEEGMTKEEAINAVELEKDMQKEEARKIEEPETDIEKDIMKELESSGMHM